MAVHLRVQQELNAGLLVGFGLTIDAKDSSVYDLTFGSLSASLGQSGYAEATEGQKAAYLAYAAELCRLIGDSDADAAAHAQEIWDLEAAIAAGSTMVRIGTAIFGARDYSKK